MAKVLAYKFIYFFLVISLLAPSFIAILDGEGENYLNMNLSEEEKKDQSEINYDEAKLFFDKNTEALILSKNMCDFICDDDYLIPAYSISVGIELPPPEQNI